MSRPGCLVLRRGSLTVQKWSHTQALTGPSVKYVDQVQRVTATLNGQPVVRYFYEIVNVRATRTSCTRIDQCHLLPPLQAL